MREATIRPYRFLIPGMDSEFNLFSSVLRVWFAPSPIDSLRVTANHAKAMISLFIDQHDFEDVVSPQHGCVERTRFQSYFYSF